MVKVTFEHVYKTMPTECTTKLTAFQEFVCTLIKLSINPPIQDLGYRFGVSTSTVSRILLKWLKQMDIRLRDLIYWPDCEALQKTMPVCFQQSFVKKVAIVIDCFEVFIERPSSLEARAASWSNYKHHNTVKVLLGITPQGVISFVSDIWGGQVSDKHLTENCGVRQKYSILRGTLPIDFSIVRKGESSPQVDKIVCVCCALNNLCDSVVPFD